MDIDQLRVTYTRSEFLTTLQTRAFIEVSKVRRGVRWGHFSFRLEPKLPQDWGNGWFRDSASLQWGYYEFGSSIDLLSPLATVAIGLFSSECKFEADCEHAYAYCDLINAVVDDMVRKVSRHEREKSDGTL